MDDKLLETLGRAQQSTESAVSPPDSQLAELLEPFAADEEASILDGAFARIESSEVPAGQAQPPEAAKDDPKVVPLAPRPSRLPWIGAVIAIAAALLLWVALRSPPPGTTSLPAYDVVQLGGGIAEVRGDDEPERAQLLPNSTIDWTFAPQVPASVPVGIALLATGPMGETEFAVVNNAEISNSGAARIRGPLSSYLALSAGTWTMQALFAVPDQLPKSAADAATDGPWQKAEFQVTILPH